VSINVYKRRLARHFLWPTLWVLIAAASCKNAHKKETTTHVEQFDPGQVASYAPERCFGAVGSKCAGAPRADVLQEGDYYIAWVSVGSIVHDNCCLRNPQKGIWCQDSPPIPWLHDGAGPCSAEWRKAFNNTLAGLQWQHKFGPYPKNDEGFSDPLDHRKGRFTKLPNSDHAFTIDYLKGETESTMKLSAKPGTKLDGVDVEFCEFKRFRSNEYGICADSTDP
jgi:hypothetical protein